MLEVKELVVSYHGIRALRGVSLTVKAGETVALIGPNGAGKSSLLNAISGLVSKTRGSVLFDGQDITHAPPWTIAAMGLLQVPEGRQIFPGLTVRENLLLGATARAGPSGRC